MVVQKADWFFADFSVIIIGFDDKLDAKVLETGWSAAGSGAKVLKTGSAGSDGAMFSKLLLLDDAKADEKSCTASEVGAKGNLRDKPPSRQNSNKGLAEVKPEN